MSWDSGKKDEQKDERECSRNHFAAEEREQEGKFGNARSYGGHWNCFIP